MTDEDGFDCVPLMAPAEKKLVRRNKTLLLSGGAGATILALLWLLQSRPPSLFDNPVVFVVFCVASLLVVVPCCVICNNIVVRAFMTPMVLVTIAAGSGFVFCSIGLLILIGEYAGVAGEYSPERVSRATTLIFLSFILFILALCDAGRFNSPKQYTLYA